MIKSSRSIPSAGARCPPDKIVPPDSADVLVKLVFNPTGSYKDRMAKP